MGSKRRRTNPHIHLGSDVNERDAWNNGYKAAMYNIRIDTPNTSEHQRGVDAGRQLERDVIGQQLILMAQEYGHAQFVFTRENLEALMVPAEELRTQLSNIETLR